MVPSFSVKIVPSFNFKMVPGFSVKIVPGFGVKVYALFCSTFLHFRRFVLFLITHNHL